MRHVVSTPGEEFGRYPNRFRDNTSKRSRSCYVTQSSTHTKTHALSNAAFAAIVARPCHYCGKRSDPPRHHNGLDRLDSSVRVYTEARGVLAQRGWRRAGRVARRGGSEAGGVRWDARASRAQAHICRGVGSARSVRRQRAAPRLRSATAAHPRPRPSAITPRA